MPRSNSSVDSPKKTKQKKLTEEEVLVLKSHLEEWKEAAANNRKKILKAVIKEAKVHAPAMDDWSLKNRKYVYQDWLYNRRSEKTGKKKASKLGQKWTSRSVIEQLRKEEIIEKTGAMPGSKKFIERYQTTLTAVMASLSKEELEEAQSTAIEWSAKPPPAAIQVDFAKKKAPGLMKDLATKLWKQASMRIFILSAWKEEDEVRINGIDFNEKLEGNSFTNMKDWKPMLSEWNAYAGEEFGRKKGRKKDEYPLKVDSYGLPVIPDVKELDLESKKRLIRMFLTKHYRWCSQQPKASVPWASVRKAQGDFIAAKFLPTGWKLDNPSKIWLADADRLLELWCQRQKDQVHPTFEFKGWEGDDKMMREPAEVISRKGSDMRPKGPVKKSTGKRTRRVEQVSSSEDGDKDDEDEEKDDNDEEKDDNDEEKDDNDEEKDDNDEEKDDNDEEKDDDDEEKDDDGEEKDDDNEEKDNDNEEKDDDNEEKDNDNKEKDDDNEEKDNNNDKKDNNNNKKDNEDDGPSPPPKSKPITNRLLVKKYRLVPPPPSKAKQTTTRCRASPAPSASEHEDPRPPVKKSMPVPLPPKSKPTKQCGRVGHIPSDLELDSQPPVKKSKPNNTSTGSAQSTGNHDNDPLPSKSRAFGPTSGIHAKKKNHKTPVPKPMPPAPRRATSKKAKGPEAQTTDPEPKRSLRSSKPSYNKAQYMQ
ncbi:hypothetical protein EDB19DRAFT_1952121 [Suillus lakei]|nr:hypothetical protein EDB19DRAFT_1952121 [Suillus lakei]